MLAKEPRPAAGPEISMPAITVLCECLANHAPKWQASGRFHHSAFNDLARQVQPQGRGDPEVSPLPERAEVRLFHLFKVFLAGVLKTCAFGGSNGSSGQLLAETWFGF